MANLDKIATVLDLAAEYVENVEREKEASATAARTTRIDKIAAKHLAAHGEEMSDAARQKLARTDSDTLDLVENLLEKQAGAVEPLGGPASDDTISTKQASPADADQRFLSWITSE